MNVIEKPGVRENYPLEYISIRLVEELSKSIESGGEYLIEYKKICPIGWYKTEIQYADPEKQSDSEEVFTEFVMVYEHTKEKLDTFMTFICSTNFLGEWSKECLDEEWMQPQIKQWIDKYFDRKSDDIGQKLQSDLIKIVRHIAQNESLPPYHSFEEREIYDLDKMAEKVINFSGYQKYEFLKEEFSTPDTLWKTFYKTLQRFDTAVDAASRNIIYSRRSELDKINPVEINPDKKNNEDRELDETEKEEVKKRDRYVCLCCGTNRLKKLQIDHIKPFCMGGKTTIENSQTLCDICNRVKGNHEISFLCKQTELSSPKKLDFSPPYAGQSPTRIITRLVNMFYHCKAVYKVSWEVLTYTYSIELYPGNNPEWLRKHQAELLNFIQKKLGGSAYNISVSTTDKT